MGPAQGAQSNPVPMPRRKEFRTLAFASEFAGKAVAQLDEGTRDTVRKGREEQGKAKDGKEHQRGDTAELIGAYRPSSAHRGEAGDERKCDRHAGKQRQAALAEGLVGARKNKWQHRQDAGAENRENATEIG